VKVPEVLIDVGLGVVGTNAPEVSARFVSVRVDICAVFLCCRSQSTHCIVGNVSNMLRKAVTALIWPTLHTCEQGGLRLEKVIVIML
jgi:hypothetical protein